MTDTRNYEAQLRAADLRARLRLLGSDSVVYGLSGAAAKLIGLFLFPVLTRLFSAEQYGAVDLIAAWGTLLGLFVIFGQDSAVARFYYEDDGEAYRQRIVLDGLKVIVTVSILGTFLLLLLSRQIIVVFFDDLSLLPLFRLMVLSLSPLALAAYWRNLMKWMFRRGQYIAFSLLPIVALVILTLLLVIRFDQGVLGVFQAQLLVHCGAAIAGWLCCRDLLSGSEEESQVVPMIRFGLPLMMVGAASAAVPAMDRMVVEHFAGFAAVGVYAVGAKIATLISMPILAFQTAWGPFSLAIYREQSAGETYNTILRYYVCGGVTLVLGLSLFGDLIVKVLATQKFSGGELVILPLGLALLMESIGWIGGIGLELSKRTWGSLIAYLAGLVAFGGSALVLTNSYGLVGTAWAVFLGKAVHAIVYVLLAAWLYPLRFRWGYTASFLTLALMLGAGELHWLRSGAIVHCVELLVFGLVALMIARVGTTPDEGDTRSTSLLVGRAKG